MSDLVTSWLRGVVPGAWSALVTALIAWAAASAPWLLSLLDVLNVDLDSPATVAFVMAVVLAAWLGLWRRIEPRVPDWLSRIAMGSAKTPTYAAVTSDGAHVITSLSPTEQQVIRDLRSIERGPVGGSA